MHNHPNTPTLPPTFPNAPAGELLQEDPPPIDPSNLTYSSHRGRTCRLKYSYNPYHHRADLVSSQALDRRLGFSTTQPPAKALASTPLIPFISCGSRARHCAAVFCPLYRALAQQNHHHHGITVAERSRRRPPPPPPLRSTPPTRNHGLLHLQVVRYPQPCCSTVSQGCELGQRTAARQKSRTGLKLALVELSPSRLLGRAVLRYSRPRACKSSPTHRTYLNLAT